MKSFVPKVRPASHPENAALLVSMRLEGISCAALPSAEARRGVRGPSVLSGALPVVHVVDRVPVDLPGEVNGDEAEDEPAEQDLEDGDSHVVREPVVHELGEERQAAVGDAGQKLEVPRLLHGGRRLAGCPRTDAGRFMSV